jgi:hypothetical protein
VRQAIDTPTPRHCSKGDFMNDRTQQPGPPGREEQRSTGTRAQIDRLDAVADSTRAPGLRDAAVADDRGLERERRSFNGDREYDELGSEMEDLGFEAADDEYGGPGRSY